MTQEKKRRSGLSIMKKLIGLVRPLLPVMLLAIFLGVTGYLCAIFLTIVAGSGLLRALLDMMDMSGLMAAGSGFLVQMGLKTCCVVLVVLAVARGFLHYGEQYCNHFIAFKLLALIRHKVFAKLRVLCPAKLEGKDRGNLVALITSDIELLEVFYAHTISPIAIAFLVSLIMVIFIASQYLPAGILALLGYVTVGLLIPLWNGRRGAQDGMNYRNEIGDLNSFVLDSLRGLDETIQYDQGAQREKELVERSWQLGDLQKKLNRREASQKALTNLTILLFSFGMLFLMLSAYQTGKTDFMRLVTATIAMMGSFGPVTALSSLSNNLNQTLASGERVLSLLEEKPQVTRIKGKDKTQFEGAAAENVDFSYGQEKILSNTSVEFPQGKVIGIHGASGSGKSTLLKLLMRFWDVDGGKIAISGKDIRDVNTRDLRNMESYVTQETYLFHDSIANNIEIGRHGASREEIVEAAQKASIHEFIETLPNGYDTKVGELGDTLSGGEKQRIGIARAFLHDAPFLLLDEPTSNLDALNEGVILKSLHESAKEKTVVLVSHRRSTMNAADEIYEMASLRKS